MIYPVILAGGAGTRVWPVSQTECPKPFTQALLGEHHPTLFQSTLHRIAGLAAYPATVVCHHSYRFMAASQAHHQGLTIGSWVLESLQRNTGPAILLSALHLHAKDANATLLILPADHLMEEAPFHTAVRQGLAHAEAGKIVTFGIPASSPSSAYGYMLAKGTEVVRFTEKPSRHEAEALIAQGAVWNSGIFLARADTLLEAAAQHAPHLLHACRQAYELAWPHSEGLLFTEEASALLPDISFDHAIANHSSTLAMLPLDAHWRDLGSWQSIWEHQAKDESGNHTRGPVEHTNCTNSYLQSDNTPLVASGLHDMVVVAHQGKLLVSSRTQAAPLRPHSASGNVPSASFTHRPWGFYQQLATNDGFKVKQLTVYPGAMTSLQRHQHRAEHWVVVAGEATVTCNDTSFILPAHASTFIPAGATHRLANLGQEPLVVIEIQTGSQLDENDIERFDDLYGRSLQAIQA